jgi:protoporphyrinogen oxidase
MVLAPQPPDAVPVSYPATLPANPDPAWAGYPRAMSTVADVVVLGAGPAGLGAAFRAASAGHRVVLLERQDRVGGAAGSFEVAGIPVDFGSHRLHLSIEPGILGALRGLLGDDLQLRRRNGRIRLAGRWIGFPLGGRDLVRNLPPAFALAAARDAALSWARRPRGDTFAEVLRAGLGPTMCRHFYFPYTRKLWGLDPDEISGEQARRRVSADSPWKLLRRLVSTGRPEGRFFHYPRRGYGQLWERLAEAASEAGAELRLGAAAERIELGDRDSGRISVRAGAGERIEGRRVFSTVPLTVLATLVNPPPPPPVLKAARRLRFRSMVLVYLVHEGGRYTPYDAHYLPGSATPVTRLSEPANYRDGPDPGDRTVLCAEIPCNRGDTVWTASPEDLESLVTEGLARVELPRARPSAVEVRRLPYAYPVYEAGYEAAFETLDSWARSDPRLLSFGRQGLFVHDNSHHALAMAWAAAGALAPGGDFDEAAWAAARLRFATHKVED